MPLRDQTLILVLCLVVTAAVTAGLRRIGGHNGSPFSSQAWDILCGVAVLFVLRDLLL